MRHLHYFTTGLLAIALLAVLVFAFVIHVSASPQNAGPPTPHSGSSNPSVGLVGVTPHINLSNPNAATFTEQDVRQFVVQHGSPLGPLVDGAHLAIEQVRFVTAQQASTIMNGEFIGLPANAPTCYVLIHGPFKITNMHHPPSFHATTASDTEMVFDGRTGKIVVWGIPASAVVQ